MNFIGKRKKILSAFAFLCITVLLLSGCGQSSVRQPSGGQSSGGQPEQKSVDYPKKEIKMVVQFSAGGGFDTLARLVTQYVPKYLPNNVTMVTVNMPGGEGAIAINEILKNDDGYTVGIFNLPGNLVGQAVTELFDLGEVAWLGQAMSEPLILLTSPKSGFKSLDDVLKAGNITTGATALTATDGLGMIIAAGKLGFKQNMLTFGGSQETILSVMRGEAKLCIYPYSTFKEMIKSGELVPLAVFSKERMPELPNVPSIAELGHDDQALIDLNTLKRTFGVSKKTDPQILAILQAAFEKAIKDPEFQKKAAELNMNITYASPAELEKAVNESIAAIKPFAPMLKKGI